MARQLKLVTIYCIDTSSLFNLKGYPKDIFPTIWKRLEDMVKRGELFSHLEVFKEVKIGRDEIFTWCKKSKRMFKDIDECQLQELENVKEKYDQNYWNRETTKTTPWADPWLIALSICESAVVVTDETNRPNRIPSISGELGIDCMTLFDLFRRMGIKY